MFIGTVANSLRFVNTGTSTPPRTPGTHPRQYLVSRGRNILYPQKFVIVAVIIVNSVLTVHIIFGVMVDAKCFKMHRFACYNSKF